MPEEIGSGTLDVMEVLVCAVAYNPCWRTSDLEKDCPHGKISVEFA